MSEKLMATPAAWMTADGRVATDETKRTAMPGPSRAVFNIPLYAAPFRPVNPDGWGPTHWALYSVSGSHIGLWADKEWVKMLQTKYPGSTILPLMAASAAPPDAERVKVKPLEWRVNQSAKSACGTYYVIPVNGRFGVSLNAMTTIAEHLGFYDTIDEAKAAAQTNYESRTLSAIEVGG